VKRVPSLKRRPCGTKRLVRFHQDGTATIWNESQGWYERGNDPGGRLLYELRELYDPRGYDRWLAEKTWAHCYPVNAMRNLREAKATKHPNGDRAMKRLALAIDAAYMLSLASGGDGNECPYVDFNE
jgi:hypothetical protein